LKFGLYAADDLAALCRGGIEVIGLGGGRSCLAVSFAKTIRRAS